MLRTSWALRRLLTIYGLLVSSIAVGECRTSHVCATPVPVLLKNVLQKRRVGRPRIDLLFLAALAQIRKLLKLNIVSPSGGPGLLPLPMDPLGPPRWDIPLHP